MTVLSRKLCVLACAAAVSGCGGRPPQPSLMTMPTAIKTVNANNDRFEKNVRLYTEGDWQVHFTAEDGTLSKENGTFKMHLLLPNQMSFKTANFFTRRLIEIGCNESDLWVWYQYQEDLLCLATRDQENVAVFRGIPLDPELMIELIGVRSISEDTTGFNGARYRVVDQYHQLFYEDIVEGGQAVIVKEYWLSRFEPFLVDRIVYRDGHGRVKMQASLSEYKRIGQAGPSIATHIDAEWPGVGRLILSIGKRKLYSGQDADSISFISPAERHLSNPRLSPPATIRRLDSR